jgi:cytidyltransferase-like protein
MIVTTEQLHKYVGQLAMVDGSFDPLHDGHIGYFRAAAEVGHPLLCNIASDKWTSSKHRVLLSQQQRGVVIDAIKYVSFVHLSATPTLSVLELLQPKVYIKGSDWVARGGVPSDEKEICQKLGIEIMYLDTVTNSSSRLLAEWSASPTSVEG